jgi:tetratricopeptide (TPR) repeat protein
MLLRHFLRICRRSLSVAAIAFSCSIAWQLVANILPSKAQSSQSVRVTSDADKKAQTQILLSQAQALFDQGLYDRSMALVNQAIDASPNNPLAWQLLGNCLKKMGRDREALTAYDQAVKLLSVNDVAIAPPFPNAPPQVLVQPNSQGSSDIGQLWIERARTLDRLNQFQESVAAYDQALKIRCHEQAQRPNEVLPPVCQTYLFSTPAATIPNNLPANSSQNSTQNSNKSTVIIPVSPPSAAPQQPIPSKNNRVIW